MKYRVIIHDEVLRGVEQFLDHMSEVKQEPLNAIRWWEKALAKIDALESMSHRCPFAPENKFSKHELRVLRVDSCLFLFHIDEAAKAVEVAKFRHSSQNG